MILDKCNFELTSSSWDLACDFFITHLTLATPGGGLIQAPYWFFICCILSHGMVKFWFWPRAYFFHNGSYVGGRHLGLNFGCRDKPGRKTPKLVFVLFHSGWFYFSGFVLFIFSIGGRNYIFISTSHFGHRWPKNPKIDPFYNVTGKFSCHFDFFFHFIRFSN